MVIYKTEQLIASARKRCLAGALAKADGAVTTDRMEQRMVRAEVCVF